MTKFSRLNQIQQEETIKKSYLATEKKKEEGRQEDQDDEKMEVNDKEQNIGRSYF